MLRALYAPLLDPAYGALSHDARIGGHFLREVDGINLRRRTAVVEAARELCGGAFRGRRVAVPGAAFKPDSDDIRDSPALDE